VKIGILTEGDSELKRLFADEGVAVGASVVG